MPEKPAFVIIGEAHPSSIEYLLILQGRLKVRMKEAGGIRRTVVDRSAGRETKKSILRIRDEIIRKEVEILKKSGIRRLLIEKPASQEMKRLYAEFKKTHDLKLLQIGLRRETHRLNAQTIQDIKDLFVKVDLWQPLHERMQKEYEMISQGSTQPMFTLSHVSVAHKAGIWDIIPIDDEQGYRQAGALPDAMYLLGDTVQEFCQSSTARSVKDSLMHAKQEYLRIAGMVDKRLERIHEKREKAIARNIRENYTQNSALICGLEHLEPLKRMLSADFGFHEHTVGSELYKSLSQH